MPPPARVFRTTCPQLLLSSADALEDLANLAQENGARRVLCLGCEPPECGLPCSAAPLGEAVPALEAALAAEAGSGTGGGEGTEPTESSDEEGGGTEGVRMRVRLSRGPDDKWGVKWHKNIFKKSHRLVVDEIVEDSLVDTWNRQQPPQLRVRYGDRLVRVNGVHTEELTPEQVGQKMRAELQKEQLRALFWRPGTLEPEAPGAVLLCASEEAAVAAAAAAARVVRRRSEPTASSPESVEALLAALGDAAALLRGPAGEAALRALLAPSEAAPEAAAGADAGSADAGAGHDAPEPTAAPESREAATGADVGSADPGASHDAPEQAAKLDSREAPSHGDEQEEEDEAEGAGQRRQPLWTYSCRKCNTGLFHDLNVLPHSTDGSKKASRAWATEQEQGEVACTSMFVEPMKWMGCLEEQTGRLLCGNPACRQKLGGYSWHGLPCSCGQWQSPAFQIHCARLDCMPAGRHSRGPAPRAVFRQ